MLSTIREQDKNIPLISVLLSGRPLLIDDLLASSDTVLAAWLPGTSGGQGIVNAIVGKYVIKPKDSPLKNTLSNRFMFMKGNLRLIIIIYYYYNYLNQIDQDINFVSNLIYFLNPDIYFFYVIICYYY